MTSQEILKADLLDIVFDQRNKMYGAYLLRKNYNNRLLIALSLSLLFVFTLYFLMPRGGAVITGPGKIPEVIVKDLSLPDLDKPKELLPPPVHSGSRTFAHTQFTDLHIVPNETEIRNAMPPVDGLGNIGDVTTPGDEGVDPYPSVPPVNSGSAPAIEAKPAVADAPLQREPEFPGGIEAWANFLRRNLRSPGELEAGEQKTVFIRFQVALDGEVTGFEIIRSAGKEFDQEVIRVLRKMPRWKPAIQNNLPVARSFTQPVTFIGAEE